MNFLNVNQMFDDQPRNIVISSVVNCFNKTILQGFNIAANIMSVGCAFISGLHMIHDNNFFSHIIKATIL